MTTMGEICAALAAAIEADAAFAAENAVAFAEDRFDPAKKVAERQTTRLRVMVAATDHARDAAGSSAAGDATIEVSVFENPARRAADPDALTVQRAAERIVALLHWTKPAGCANRLRYRSMRRADATEQDYRMTVEFALRVDPAGDDEVVTWTAGEATVWGAVEEKTVARGGTVAYELSRTGAVMAVGARDRHWRCAVVCAVDGALEPDALPEIGSNFAFGARTYVCESAEMSAGETKTTVRLSGRTA